LPTLEQNPQTDQLDGHVPESELKFMKPRQAERFVPPVPQSLTDTGMPNSLIEQLILKLLYFKA
jgi:hypothetical protein